MVSYRSRRKHKTIKRRQRKRTYNRKKYSTIRRKRSSKKKKSRTKRIVKSNKNRRIKINKNFYARPTKKGGEFMLFPDVNGAKNGIIDGASNFINGLRGVNNTETGDVMKQNLQSGTYDITGSKQLLDAAEKMVGPEPAPAPQPNPAGNCAPVQSSGEGAGASTQQSTATSSSSS
jgi:hypothetical protein